MLHQPITADTETLAPAEVRRERIEALGDSNPPAMSEVIGHMLMVAHPSRSLTSPDPAASVAGRG